MNFITRHHIVVMNYEEHENDNLNKNHVRFRLTTLGFQKER